MYSRRLFHGWTKARAKTPSNPELCAAVPRSGEQPDVGCAFQNALKPDITRRVWPQERALVTYVKRAYFPFVLREPQLRSAGGRVASAMWAYADPATAVLIVLDYLPVLSVYRRGNSGKQHVSCWLAHKTTSVYAGHRHQLRMLWRSGPDQVALRAASRFGEPDGARS